MVTYHHRSSTFSLLLLLALCWQYAICFHTTTLADDYCNIRCRVRSSFAKTPRSHTKSLPLVIVSVSTVKPRNPIDHERFFIRSATIPARSAVRMCGEIFHSICSTVQSVKVPLPLPTGARGSDAASNVTFEIGYESVLRFPARWLVATPWVVAAQPCYFFTLRLTKMQFQCMSGWSVVLPKHS